MPREIPHARTLEIVYEVECDDVCEEFDHPAEAEAELEKYLQSKAATHPNVKQEEVDLGIREIALTDPVEGETIYAYVRRVCYLWDEYGCKEKVPNGIYD